MISHPYKCIFVHQPKTGGTSILKTFGMDWNNPDSFFMNSGVCGADSPLRPLGYFTFSVVRNPYDRFISGWKYCRYTRERSLMDVLRNMPDYPKDLKVITDPDSEYYAGSHITASQSGRLLLPGGSVGVALIVRYEELQAGFDQVCDIIGKERGTLPRENLTSRESYRYYFDSEPEAKRLFEQHFETDLELFKYCY